ncbi:hypothetical protein PLEOSDRAFT_169212 [Pleurotus ostreatus PC15]|uniref:Uncharacterized protein n=1 Tax=Pleurotus ostreatus (strain PC15) TaxID=1137138 RepID=A0A067NHB1_PLEO1|nr:hypothetical protein PLEOSDRAFT_169212 [Pleurotus ostreatus PC15]
MMASQTVSFNDGQMLLPSDRNMADVQPSNTLPSADGMACALGSFLAPAPLNPVLAEFGIADDLNALTTVTEYKYGASEDCDIDCDDIHCASGSFSTWGASMDVVTAEFSITEDLNTPMSVRKYEYDSSEGSDDDSKMDSDDGEGWATVMSEEDTDGEDGGWFTAVSHFSDASDMEVYEIDEGYFARQQTSVQPLFPLTPVRSWGPRGTM